MVLNGFVQFPNGSPGFESLGQAQNIRQEKADQKASQKEHAVGKYRCLVLLEVHVDAQLLFVEEVALILKDDQPNEPDYKKPEDPFDFFHLTPLAPGGESLDDHHLPKAVPESGQHAGHLSDTAVNG